MKKFLSLILAILMVTAIVPLNAFAEEAKKAAGNIEIYLDPKIAGKSPAEYREFITVSGEGVELGAEDYFETTHSINNSGFEEIIKTEVFEEGERYTSVFYIYPQEGYVLDGIIEPVALKYYVHRSTGTVEGSAYCVPCVVDGDGNAEYYRVLIHYTAEAQEPTGFARISYVISQFFLSIADFFTETFIEPIADLIMKF